MRQYLRDRALSLVVFSFVGLAAMFVQPILANFNQASSATNTVAAQSATIQVADANETTFAASVSASLALTGANALQNDGVYKLAGYIDLLSIAGTADTKYTIANSANPAPDGGTNHAAVNDNLKVVIWASQDAGSGLSAGSARPLGAVTCPATAGRVGTGPLSPIVAADTEWKTLNVADLALPAAGTAKRLCVYLALPATTPQTAAGGSVAYALTLTSAP